MSDSDLVLTTSESEGYSPSNTPSSTKSFISNRSETFMNLDDDIETCFSGRGYNIPKAILSEKQEKKIREDLTVSPITPGMIQTKPVYYPIYRESGLKFYVPLYYGISKFGEPKEIRLSEPIKINCKFESELRDYQIDIVNTYLSNCNKKPYFGGLLDIQTGRGKTVMALYILSQLGYKTIIVVHKTFLADQWIERIQQFLPSARIGRIQGENVDIQNKDIVIGMIQSISMKEYHENVFNQFGLSIYDECHHVSSETFCNSVKKIVTRYSLGLSATMNRKDGLTRVFKMFIGPILYQDNKETDQPVTIKMIEYVTDNEDFNKEVKDYRGNVAYSTMISKLCQYNSRSEFILEIIMNELKRDETQQMMLIGHNKSLLVYLSKGLETRGYGEDYGFYVGGMKQDKLKETEKKKIVLATYSMASEGLDIKTLSTVFMLSPKTDVVQTIGRVLREKHGKALVIDLVDSHQVFQNQMRKRLTYYKKMKYNIQHYGYQSYIQNPNQYACISGKRGARVTNKRNEPILNGKCLI